MTWTQITLMLGLLSFLLNTSLWWGHTNGHTQWHRPDCESSLTILCWDDRTLSQSASCWMVLTSVGSSSEWGLLCIMGCRGRWEATCWSLHSSFSLEVKSWVIASSPSAAQANGEVACLEDILLQKKETAGIKKGWQQPKNIK